MQNHLTKYSPVTELNWVRNTNCQTVNQDNNYSSCHKLASRLNHHSLANFFHPLVTSPAIGVCHLSLWILTMSSSFKHYLILRTSNEYFCATIQCGIRFLHLFCYLWCSVFLLGCFCTVPHSQKLFFSLNCMASRVILFALECFVD